MVNSLINTGSFYIPTRNILEGGNIEITQTSGEINQLAGMLNFIDSVNRFNDANIPKRVNEKDLAFDC